MKESKKGIVTAAKGLIVGSTMMVPGVSGNVKFLLVFGIPALLGMFLFASPLESLINAYEKPMMFFFIGIVLGGCPLIFREAGIEKVTWKEVLNLAIGAVIVVAISFLPKNLFASTTGGFSGFMILFIGGIIVSIALILPGISVTYMLLVLGIYKGVLQAVGNINIPYLLPLAVGLIAGIIFLTKALETAMKRFPKPTYMIILGFVLGSVGQVFPGVPTGIEIPICLLLGIAGFVIIYFLSKLEEQKTKELESDTANALY